MSRRPSFADRILIMHRALASAGIEHGFGGAVALAYSVQEPRATRGIDLNIYVSTRQAGSVVRAMPEGIEVEADAAKLVAHDGQIRLWWDGPSGIPVDVFFPHHDFHKRVADDTQTVPFLEATIPVISATHLTVFKCLFNRPRDWPDIQAMLDAGSVEVDDAKAWVARLLGKDAEPLSRLAGMARAAASR